MIEGYSSAVWHATKVAFNSYFCFRLGPSKKLENTAITWHSDTTDVKWRQMAIPQNVRIVAEKQNTLLFPWLTPQAQNTCFTPYSASLLYMLRKYFRKDGIDLHMQKISRFVHMC